MTSSKPVRLIGQDPHIFEIPQWLNVHHDPASKEVWIDMHGYNRIAGENGTITREPVTEEQLGDAESAVVFDFGTGQPSLDAGEIQWVKNIGGLRPTKWLTLNAKAVPGISTIRFDYYWNRTKLAFLDRTPMHKLFGVENFIQYPLHTNQRQKKFLNFYSRVEPRRTQLRDHLVSRYDGFYNNSEQSIWLNPNVHFAEHNYQAGCAPPARLYFDESYVTCLVETSYCDKNNILYSEKTYDSLIQGRGVINFANPGFYQQLVQDGWQLPNYINWSWDQIEDDEQRWNAFVVEVDRLLSLNIQQLHDWFMSNMSCWQHNQEMLRSKPYDIIDCNSI